MGDTERKRSKALHTQYIYIRINKQQSDESERKKLAKDVEFQWRKSGELEQKTNKERAVDRSSQRERKSRIEAKNNFPGEKIQKKWNKRALLQ